jgi:pimeloyl-ACP methyl ester carboxylesterase
MFVQIAVGLGGAILAALLLAVALEAFQQARDRWRFLAPGRLIDVGGRRLHLVCQGEGPVTVVLVPGGGNPGATFWPPQRAIAGFARVCVYDRAGLGWSDPAPHGLSFDEQARDLHTLLSKASEVAPYLLAGGSFGGLIVRAFARLYPGEVAGVVLIDAAEEEHVFARLELLIGSVRRQLAMVRWLGPLGLVRWAVRKTPRGSYSDADFEVLVAQISRPAHWIALASEGQAYALTPHADRGAGGFGRLGDRLLTVLAHGQPFPDARLEDGWREAQERLAALSSNGRLVVAEGVGHTIAEEAPGLVAAEVRRMLDGSIPGRIQVS